jgi:glycosyltransferase involved in cell wall biosynthesis
MKIALATDAWAPQVNGVVRTLTETVARVRQRGDEVIVISPDQFFTAKLPGYSEIRLALAPRFGVWRRLDAARPDIVHIATEGPIGWSARRWCLDRGVPFTSAFHTRFPDYAAVRTGIAAERFWPLMRRFHQPSRAVLAATASLIDELAGRGIPHSRLWSRGIDLSLFRPACPPHPLLARLPRPILLSVGRVAIEKNIEAFLDCETPGTKVVVGDGPALAALKKRYPQAVFTGGMRGEELASAYAAADVFVFPSRTDTFGLVMIEALACGVPVAGYPVPGPLDVVGRAGLGPLGTLARPIGAVDEELAQAIERALRVQRADAAAYGCSFDWERSTDQFVAALEQAVEQCPAAA